MKNNTKQTAEQAGAQCLRDSIHTLFFFQKYSVKQFLTLYSLSILSQEFGLRASTQYFLTNEVQVTMVTGGAFIKKMNCGD